MARGRTRIKATPEATLDLLQIVPMVCAKFGLHRNGELIDLLNALQIDGCRFRFVFDDRTRFKIFVKCPRCDGRKLKLHRVGSYGGKKGVYYCSDCHQLCRPARQRRRSSLYHQVIRPLLKLKEINERILTEDLSPTQLRRLCKKAMLIQKALPEYVLAAKEEMEKLAKLARN